MGLEQTGLPTGNTLAEVRSHSLSLAPKANIAASITPAPVPSQPSSVSSALASPHPSDIFPGWCIAPLTFPGPVPAPPREPSHLVSGASAALGRSGVFFAFLGLRGWKPTRLWVGQSRVRRMGGRVQRVEGIRRLGTNSCHLEHCWTGRGLDKQARFHRLLHCHRMRKG